MRRDQPPSAAGGQIEGELSREIAVDLDPVPFHQDTRVRSGQLGQQGGAGAVDRGREPGGDLLLGGETVTGDEQAGGAVRGRGEVSGRPEPVGPDALDPGPDGMARQLGITAQATVAQVDEEPGK
ncbi:hypothetical protein GCM10012289_63220 [Nonomuraea cavernae]|uniref:Uncharacterized protein n=1 Tax=Nonomuraea cavernae TaxID=2045107 RepID=A0A918DRE9_9ACTN|nr:hypothetical protein GCM10012289_63220 [Nonomuraea cavernae]